MGPVTALRRRVPAAFGLAAVALCAFGGCGAWAVRELMSASGWVAHTQLVLLQLNGVGAALEQSAASQREFLLLGLEDSLREYEAAETAVAKELADLRRLTADNISQQTRLGALEETIARRLKLSDESVRIRRAEGADASMRFISSRAGRRALAAARAGLEDMRREERRLLDERTRAQARRAALALAVVAAGTLFAILLLAAAARSTLADMRRRREIEEELESFFELSEDLLSIADFDGRFMRVNAAWQRLLGYPKERLLSRPLIALVHDDDKAKTLTEAARLAEGAKTVSFENRYRCADGTYKTLRWTSTPSVDRRRIYAVARDVTLELELERVRVEVTHHVNHELRNPTAAIIMSLSMLQDYRSNALPEATRVIDGAMSAARHLQRMVDDLLDVTRLETGKLSVESEPFDLSETLRDAVTTSRPTADRRGVFLRAEIAPELRCSGDSIRARQVATNLLDNAIKFTPTGGTVRLSAGPSPEEPGKWLVSVEDTGPGIPKEDLARLFDRLYQSRRTAKQRTQGLGLGLAICKELVERQGGRIWAESEPGKGSALRFTLPRAIS